MRRSGWIVGLVDRPNCIPLDHVESCPEGSKQERNSQDEYGYRLPVVNGHMHLSHFPGSFASLCDSRCSARPRILSPPSLICALVSLGLQTCSSVSERPRLCSARLRFQLESGDSAVEAPSVRLPWLWRQRPVFQRPGTHPQRG